MISNSELSCFRRCPREWQHRFIDNRQSLVEGKALGTGKRVHAALAGEGVELTTVERAMVRGHAARWRHAPLDILSHNVAWEATIGMVDMVGEFDGLTATQIVEHKTTSEDISPGSAYWRRVVNVDPQATTYLAAARALKLPQTSVLWNVIRKPLLRLKNAETEAQFFARLLEDMASKPDWYFQRATIVRLEHEHDAFVHDVESWSLAMDSSSHTRAPRNPDACMKFGRECDFFGVCSGEISLSDDARFTARTYRMVRK